MRDDRSRSLFTPIAIGPYLLPNRIVMAPMTRNRAGQGNAPTALNAEYYAQRASAGLIITEASQVSPQGVGYPGTPGIHTDRQVAGWRLVTGEVHARGGRIFLQLWHVGRISHPSLQPDGELPVAPSGIKPAGEAFTFEGMQPFVTPRELGTHEIPGIVGQFREAAVNAKTAGFDGVEIHAANGYLLDQFLRDGTNQRGDRYGGSVENRVRFPLEVVQAVAEVWGSDRVGVRISPTGTFNNMHDSSPDRTFGGFVEKLAPLGLAYLHVVEEIPEFDYTNLRRLCRGPCMANGGYTLKQAEAAIAVGRADLVSFARPFLANPDLPRRFALGAPLNPPDTTSFYGGDARGYTDYPTLEQLQEAEQVPALG